MMSNTQYTARRADKAVDAATNEDAVLAKPNIIAVSDGAGGCGIFADRWSEYLLSKLTEKPFATFTEFSQWTDQIWQEFYNDIERGLSQYSPIVQNKFNNEGSYATLAAVWHNTQNSTIDWCCYGDSAIFVYRPSTGKMVFMSCIEIETYNRNPHLINWKDIPSEKHFREGKVAIETTDMVFCASDALSCMLTMSYYASQDREQLLKCSNSDTRLAHHAREILEWSTTHKFYEDMLKPLIAACDNAQFAEKLHAFHKIGILGNDDYSLVWFNSKKEQKNTSTKFICINQIPKRLRTSKIKKLLKKINRQHRSLC